MRRAGLNAKHPPEFPYFSPLLLKVNMVVNLVSKPLVKWRNGTLGAF